MGPGAGFCMQYGCRCISLITPDPFFPIATHTTKEHADVGRPRAELITKSNKNAGAAAPGVAAVKLKLEARCDDPSCRCECALKAEVAAANHNPGPTVATNTGAGAGHGTKAKKDADDVEDLTVPQPSHVVRLKLKDMAAEDVTYGRLMDVAKSALEKCEVVKAQGRRGPVARALQEAVMRLEEKVPAAGLEAKGEGDRRRWYAYVNVDVGHCMLVLPIGVLPLFRVVACTFNVFVSAYVCMYVCAVCVCLFVCNTGSCRWDVVKLDDKNTYSHETNKAARQLIHQAYKSAFSAEERLALFVKNNPAALKDQVTDEAMDSFVDKVSSAVWRANLSKQKSLEAKVAAAASGSAAPAAGAGADAGADDKDSTGSKAKARKSKTTK